MMYYPSVLVVIVANCNEGAFAALHVDEPSPRGAPVGGDSLLVFA